MKARQLSIAVGSLLLAPATRALAATVERQDNSQFLVWAFLGMCALIVIIQLMPVAMIAFGLLKGLTKGKAVQPQAETAANE